ncbi:hypothetical protein ACE3MQ_01265 [Paenibacillus lentus]
MIVRKWGCLLPKKMIAPSQSRNQGYRFANGAELPYFLVGR